MFPKNLITDKARVKAALVMDLKSLALQLDLLSWQGLEEKELTLQRKIVCDLAISHAQSLVDLLLINSLEPKLGLSIDAYIDRIQKIQKSFSLSLAEFQQAEVVQKLLAYYQGLALSLEELSQQPELVARPAGLPHPFNEQMLGSTVNTFVLDLVKYWNHCELTDFENTAFFSNLSETDLQIWIDRFTQEDFVLLYKTLFYYKINPETLFDQKIHPEKLVSIHFRLDFIYQYIENLRQQLANQIQQISTNRLQDYLLHGDEVPPGIIIEAEEIYKQQIAQAVALMKIKIRSQVNDETLETQVHHMKQAYKFWFNPNRLIDAVMVLKQQFMSQNQLSELNESDFLLFLMDLFEHLSTNDCLDLYGLFSNKDTVYLMRTLEAGMNNQLGQWLPGLTTEEISTLKLVFTALNVTMRALVEVLAARKIATEPYAFTQPSSKPLQPGQRNRLAVQRVINVYGNRQVTGVSQTIEDLFHLVENAEAL